MAHDLVPAEQQIGREALERIIHRAAQLQAHQHEVGDHLTEREVLSLGRDVGIPQRFLQQAILEERTRAVATESGAVFRIAGPRRVSAERVVPGTRDDVIASLNHWMTETELLAVKRRFPSGGSWEARKDWFAAMKRGFGAGGRRYVLARANDVASHVQALEDGWCHVSLVADVANLRKERAIGGGLLAAAGATGTTIGVVLGVLVPVALIPAVACTVGGIAIVRSNLAQSARVHVALEQVLDRLEHGEITRPKPPPPPSAGSFVRRITEEIHRAVGGKDTRTGRD